MQPEQYTAIMNSLETNNTKLGELLGDFREFKGVQETKVNALEEAAKSDKFWGRVQTIAVLPIMTVLHIGASKLGLIK